MIEDIKMFKNRSKNHFHGNVGRGIDCLQILEEFLKCGDYNYQVFDTRSIKGQPDDILIAVHVE
jgi:hypothetical protein